MRKSEMPVVIEQVLSLDQTYGDFILLIETGLYNAFYGRALICRSISPGSVVGALQLWPVHT